MLLIITSCTRDQGGFRYLPYLQNPSPHAMTILWFSETNTPGKLTLSVPNMDSQESMISQPIPADALKYSTWEDTTFFDGAAPSVPFRHRIRIENLKPATVYAYTVRQGNQRFHASFKTAPDGNVPVRFIVYADSETEPESTGKFCRWDNPRSDKPRKYLIDQTQGYHNNLEVIQAREPDLVLIAGDLVQHGGEQRDWDEFWRHNTDQTSLASTVPVMAAIGNHEYYEGPYLDRYNQPGSERAVNKYLTYFEYPANQAPRADQEGRYYSLKYGPATLIVVDLCNNSPANSTDDTNFFLLGENDVGGGYAPDFGLHSRQYKWIETQLIEAQVNSLFTFVIFHHAPYSSGPHGFPPGVDGNTDKQSGRPARLLTQLFMHYGVDAVFSGHDEMWERSRISGKEVKPDGREMNHSIQFYDVGIGGDGLRAPISGLENPYREFLVNEDVPEEWKEGVLINGGKHYGHLEIDIMPQDADTWQAVLMPIYIFPILDADKKAYSSYARRMYNDQITITQSIKQSK